MQLQSDIVGQMAAHPSGSGGHGASITSDSGQYDAGMGATGRAGLLNSLSEA